MGRLNFCSIIVLLTGVTLLGSMGPTLPLAANASGQTEKVSSVPDGFCPEHLVPEAICTKCNPSLAIVFKARGDWCDEHEFPLSVCPTCNPGAAENIVEDLTADEAPADGTMVLLKSSKVAQIMGIETVQAVEQKISREIRALATVAYDASRVAQVNPRAGGVVRKIWVEVGSRVKPGSSMAVIESATVGADRSRLHAAAARAEAAEAHYLREKALHSKGISARKEMLEARQEWEEARAGVTAAEAALKVIGPDTSDKGSYVLVSPQGGVVTERSISVGQFVHGEEVLFEIVDTSKVWVEIDVKETDLASVRVGQTTILTFDALGDREFRGQIDYIAPQINPRTRRARARVVLGNRDGVLRANLYGRARILVSAPKESVMVPREAVQYVRGAKLVFVKLADNEYETRRVEASPVDPDDFLIALADGVAPGEYVVTTGSFLLKTETLMDSLGDGCTP